MNGIRPLATLLGMLCSCLVAAHALAQEATPTPTPTPTATPAQHVWTIDEILAEPKLSNAKPPIEYCQGGRFKPCVCWQDVSRLMRYRPAVAECGGNAAIILQGKYKNIFSVVVRDKDNRDRWPTSGFGNCTRYERDVLGLNKCSAFKEQKKLVAGVGKTRSVIHCLGASGYSPLFRRVTRVTAKLSDDPTGSDDPLTRWCLRRPTQPLN